MFAYRVSVKRDGEIYELPIVTTKEALISEALELCKGYGSAMEGEIVSVAPATLNDVSGVVGEVIDEFFNIKELAAVCAQSIDCVRSPSEEQIMRTLQLAVIIRQKANRTMELLNVIDKVTFPLTVPELAD